MSEHEQETMEQEAEPEFDFSAGAIKAKLDAERDTETVDAEPDVEPEPEPEAPQERARDENGRFAPERPDWLPENYRNVEEFVHESSEAQRLIGRLGQELGELRQQVQQRRADPGDIEAALDENPTAIPHVVDQARQRGDAATFDVAMNAWYEYAPRQAAAYERRMELAALDQHWQQRLDQTVGPHQEDRTNREWGQAIGQFFSSKPDLAGEDGDAFAMKMAEATATSPTLARIAADPSASHEQRLEALEVLYYKAGGRESGSPQPTRPRTDKTTVGVASSSSNSGATEDARAAALRRFKDSIINA